MNKSDIDQMVAEQLGMSVKEVDAVTDAFLGGVVEAVATGKDADLHQFGTFEPKQLQARKGRNPRTGEVIDIPTRQTVRFRPWLRFKDALNAG